MRWSSLRASFRVPNLRWAPRTVHLRRILGGEIAVRWEAWRLGCRAIPEPGNWRVVIIALDPAGEFG
jgi:hypothetical protein